MHQKMRQTDGWQRHVAYMPCTPYTSPILSLIFLKSRDQTQHQACPAKATTPASSVQISDGVSGAIKEGRWRKISTLLTCSSNVVLDCMHGTV